MIYIVQLLAVVCLVWMLRQNRQQKKLQDALVTPLRGKRFWRIHLARPSYHANVWRFSPVEATGALIDENDKIRFLGFRLNNKKPFEVVLDKREITITWLGRQCSAVRFTGLNAPARREACSFAQTTETSCSHAPHCATC